MAWETIVQFLGVAILLTVMPGPDNLFVIAQSVSHGKKAGVIIALGLCSGVILHTLAAALGISAVLYSSAFAFQVIKFAGAAYLLYLAWQAWKEPAGALITGDAPALKPGALFRRGILMNVLNPKVSLFFLALLPQFVTPGRPEASLHMIFLGLVFMVQAILIFTCFALFAGSVGVRLSNRPGAGGVVKSGKVMLYALLGIRLVFVEK
ncbi:Threonine/homoserine/homoserine lactone efflux protein [Marininema mesophilum]|uniref:Threonine/homoserine/homoserine lactone efflux protein n=1 Tax=Marininema mesophilum TaxID=1048340 RepID=A0A1H2XZ53_9BACL|nr:LysE family translocator [Marininema mesophilum]SDW98232.1 Threonine/homoserine/homoserine lactone efflux protein [Marininema mesophilum]